MGEYSIVRFGGGASAFAFSDSIQDPLVESFTMVHTICDDGGSTGKLLKAYGGLPVGDVRRGLTAALGRDSDMGRTLEYRFEGGPFKGHVVGNVLLAGMQQVMPLDEALKAATQLFQAPIQVLPSSNSSAALVARMTSGKEVVGEHDIDEYHGWDPTKESIASVSLKPNVQAHPNALEAIQEADLIVLGPGDTFTSIMPAILPKGMREALQNVAQSKRIPIVFMAPLHEEPGQTSGRSLGALIDLVGAHLGKKIISHVVYEDPETIDQHGHPEYEQPIQVIQKELDARPDIEWLKGSFLQQQAIKKSASDKLRRSRCVHDPAKVSNVLLQILECVSC